MAVLTPPELPSLILNGSKTHKYVATYKNIWDKKNGKSSRESAVTVGKFIPVVEGDFSYGEVIFNNRFLEKYPSLSDFRVFRKKGGKLEFKPVDEELFTVEQRSTTYKLHGGASWALNNIVSESPIGRALSKVFNEHANDKKILSLIYYLCISKNNAFCNYEEFAECTWLPYSGTLKSYAISRLLKNITIDTTERFLKALYTEFKAQYGESISSHTFYALDSTSISTYSAMSSAEYGHNKDLEDLPQTNVLLIVDQQTRTPIYFRNFDGNVPDVSTVRNTIADLTRIGLTDSSVVLVSDKGYISTANIDDCLRNNLSFVFNSKVNANGFARQLALENYHHLLDWNNGISFLNQTAYTVALPWNYDSFPVEGKRQYKKDKARVYVHIYFNRDICDDRTDILQHNLLKIREKYNTMPDKITPIEKRYVDLYMTEKDGKVEINMRKVQEELKLSGIRVLISDTISDPLECYIIYYERNQVEFAFNDLKAKLNCNRTRVHSSEAWQGKLLIQVLAASVAGMVRNRIKLYNGEAKNDKSTYSVIYDSDTKILNKLNNIMMTKFKDGWYFDEIAGKKKDLFAFLNVPVPSANQEIPNGNTDEDANTEDNTENTSLEPASEIL